MSEALREANRGHEASANERINRANGEYNRLCERLNSRATE